MVLGRRATGSAALRIRLIHTADGPGTSQSSACAVCSPAAVITPDAACCTTRARTCRHCCARQMPARVADCRTSVCSSSAALQCTRRAMEPPTRATRSCTGGQEGKRDRRVSISNHVKRWCRRNNGAWLAHADLISFEPRCRRRSAICATNSPASGHPPPAHPAAATARVTPAAAPPASAPSSQRAWPAQRTQRRGSSCGKAEWGWGGVLLSGQSAAWGMKPTRRLVRQCGRYSVHRLGHSHHPLSSH